MMKKSGRTEEGCVQWKGVWDEATRGGRGGEGRGRGEGRKDEKGGGGKKQTQKKEEEESGEEWKA